jgi:uncharacterized RDD family membrane protein YckC
MTEEPGTLRIVTPEGVMFRYALAGPVVRAVAWVIDAACVLGISGAIGALLHRFGFLNADVARALTTLLFALLSVGYSMYFEWYWRGQTMGKRVMNLRVIDAEGLHLQPFQIVIRNLLRCVDALPLFYLVGGIASAMSRKAQRLGDMAAHTVVVRTSNPKQPDLEKIGPVKYNSLLEYPALCARLRQKTTAEAASAAFAALLRRDQLEANARADLFRDIAAYFMAIADFPPEIIEQITPEQLVRNIVAVLYTRDYPQIKRGSTPKEAARF